MVVYRIDDRVPLDVPGEGRYELLAFAPMHPAELEKFAAIELKHESTHDVDGRCRFAKEFSTSLRISGYGLTNDGINFTGYPVVGYQNELQAFASCLDNPDGTSPMVCMWDPRYKAQLYHSTSLSIAMSNVNSFLKDLKKLFGLIPESTCGLESYNGILMRYIKASSAYLGKQEDSIEFDIMYYRSRDPMIPRMYEEVLEEMEQMAIFKYRALAHWGKNRNVAFEGVVNKYDKAGRFLQVKEKYDPMRLFSCKWTDEVLGLGGGVTIRREGCALEGLCVCSEDSHCAPAKGYFCKPGKVYKEARVCTLINYNDKHTEL